MFSLCPVAAGNLEIYYFVYFVQSSSMCLQLLGDSPPDPHWGSASGPRWGTSVPRPPLLSPLSKFLPTPLTADQILITRVQNFRPQHA